MTAPVVLLLTASEENAGVPRAFARLRGEVGGQVSGTSVRLAALGEDEIRELVEQMASWCRSEEDRDRLTRRIAFESGGNPFFAVTLLDGLDQMPTLKDDLLTWPSPRRTFADQLPFTMPDLVRMAISARMAELDDDAVAVMRAASIGGAALDTELIETLTDLSTERVATALDDLEQRRLMVFDGARYAFQAALLGEVVRNEFLTGGKRKRLRVRAIAALGKREDLESRVLRCELLEKVEPGPETVQYALAVAEDAQLAGSPRAVRRGLGVADRLAGPEDDEPRARIAALRSSIEG
jgi:hypothetical protein